MTPDINQNENGLYVDKKIPNKNRSYDYDILADVSGGSGDKANPQESTSKPTHLYQVSGITKRKTEWKTEQKMDCLKT